MSGMDGLHCVVTGASGGIGAAIAETLLRDGAAVTLVARESTRLDSTTARLQELGGATRVRAIGADLSVQADVRRAFASLVERPVDVLVLNAAFVPEARRLTIDGIEETLAVNHLAPFLLVQLARPHLKPGSRIVVVGADPTILAAQPVQIDDLQMQRNFSPTRAYMRTKNMSAMFTYALARRLEGSGVTANAAHPGIIRTQLARRATGLMKLALSLVGPLLPGPERGADTPAWLARAPEVSGVNGRFFVKRRAVTTAAHTRDVWRQEQLWRASAALVGVDA